jgi:hypothetical protein
MVALVVKEDVGRYAEKTVLLNRKDLRRGNLIEKFHQTPLRSQRIKRSQCS